MPQKTILPGLLIAALLLSACTFQPVVTTPPPVSPIPQENLAPAEGSASTGPVAETEPEEEGEAPAATEEIPLPSEMETEAASPWEATAPQSGDLLLWYALPPQTPADLAFNRLVDDFNARNEYGLTVYAFNLSTPAEILSRTLPLLGTADVPALIALTPEQEERYAEALLPLNDLLESPTWGIPAEERATWSAPLLPGGDVLPDEEEDILSLPVGTEARGLALNMDWLARLGYYNAPATPEEFASLVCKAAARPYRPDGVAVGYSFVPSLEELRAWTQVFGGQLYDPDAGAYRFEQPAVQEALAFLQDLYGQGCLSLTGNAVEAQEAFETGRAALIIHPASALHPHFPWRTAPAFNWQMDTLPGGTLALSAGLRLAIPRSTPQRELAAFSFLRYALSPEAQTQFAADSAWFPLQAQAVASSGLPSRYGRLYKAILLSPPYRGMLLAPEQESRISRILSRVVQGASVEDAVQSLQRAVGTP